MPLFLTVLLSAALSATPADTTGLPRGNDRFRLGMSRAEVDSAVANRELQVISNGTAFLVCAGGEPTVEYEQYSFFIPPHGEQMLWKVTVGYRLEASRKDLEEVLHQLEERLGRPTSDSNANLVLRDSYGEQQLPEERLVTWDDAATQVRLGGRWTHEPDRNADRMLVTWTDRRIQRLVEARRKKDKPANDN